MLEQARGQFELSGGGEAQPDPGAQFDDQFVQRGWRRQFDLHEAGGGPGFGLGVPPAAEGRVSEALTTREGGGGQSARGKRGQQFGAPGRGGARTAAGRL